MHKLVNLLSAKIPDASRNINKTDFLMRSSLLMKQIFYNKDNLKFVHLYSINITL